MGIFVTKKLLRFLGACEPSMQLFTEKYPNGGTSH